MHWLTLQFETTHEASDLISEYMRALGADGVEVQDAEEIEAIINHPDSLTYADEGFFESLSPAVLIKAYFAFLDEQVQFVKQPDMMSDNKGLKESGTVSELEIAVRQKLNDFSDFIDLGAGYTGYQLLDDADWAENWKQHYRTLKLTSRLTVNPSWIAYEPGPEEIVIQMDPGSAFGTGTHETTALCAEILDRQLKGNESILDLGTGSGILAIIAAKLGAACVEAIDIDPMAVAVAKQNIEDNDVTIDCHTGELQQAKQPKYQVIVANIIASVILELLPDLSMRLAKEGRLIVSGIIKEREKEILQKVSEQGLQIEARYERNDWLAFVLTKI